MVVEDSGATVDVVVDSARVLDVVVSGAVVVVVSAMVVGGALVAVVSAVSVLCLQAVAVIASAATVASERLGFRGVSPVAICPAQVANSGGLWD